MTWSARIKRNEWCLYHGNRLAFCVDGLPPEARGDVETIVNALNMYGPANALMREITRAEGYMDDRMVNYAATAAMILSVKVAVKCVSTVEIGNVPDQYADE